MTEKRFFITNGKHMVLEYEFYKGKNRLSPSQVIDLLNDLHEENEQLKQDKTNLYQTMSRDRVKYNQFKDKVFCRIDKKIKLLKDCHMSNEARILEDLRKEMMWND